MSEWSNVPVLKTGEGYTSGGSNPPLPATSLFNNIQNNPINPLNTRLNQLFVTKSSNTIHGNPSSYTVGFLPSCPKKLLPLSDSNIKTAKTKDKQYTLNDSDGENYSFKVINYL